MPFRETFDCLWCGTPHTTRAPDDIEGWAQLCPTCVGKAGENGFLRFRLRQAITERGRAKGAGGSPPTGSAAPERPGDQPDPADPADLDDWYQRRGRHARGPIHDTAWHAELDAAGRWLDALPMRGRIVELAAGIGWWSPLLAGKGELTLYDANGALLDRARDRLVAHGLRAHIHERDPWRSPDPDDGADALVLAFHLGSVESGRHRQALDLARRWVAAGGMLAIIDVRHGADPARPGIDPEALRSALARAGFVDVEVTTTGRFLVLASARG